MGVLLTKEEVLLRFEKYGFHICNINDYKDSRSNMKCYDKNNYYYSIRVGNLSKGHQFVSKLNPYTIDNIKQYLKLNSNGTILLSKEYISSESLLEFQCSCGNKFKRSWLNLSTQTYKTCEGCALKERGNTRKIDFNIVKKRFEEHGLTLLQTDYIGNSDRMECMDEFGYIGKTAFNHLSRINLVKNNGIERFSISHNKEYLIYNLNVFCKLNNIKSKAIKIDDLKTHSRPTILFQCECGNYFHTTIPSFTSGKTRCDECSNSISRYEYLTRNYLQSLDINFVQEKYYKDCRNILPLPFDFYIQNKNLLIEIDGEGHYKPCYFNHCSEENAIKTFNSTKRDDKIKNEYCKKNDIKLIRIPYYDFKNNKYKEILYNNIIKN